MNSHYQTGQLPIILTITERQREWLPIVEQLRLLPSDVKIISPQEILLRVEELMPDLVLIDSRISSTPVSQICKVLKNNVRTENFELIAICETGKTKQLYKSGVDLCLTQEELKEPNNIYRLIQHWFSLQHREEKLKKLERELRELQQTLTQQRKNYALFVGSLSHEIRTPLGIIEGFVTNLLDELQGPLNREQKESVEIIHRQIRKLNQYLEEILDQSKLEANDREPNSSPELPPASEKEENKKPQRKFRRRYLSLREIIRDTVELFSENFRNKNLQLKLSIDKKLPNLWMDPIKIRQLLINLLSNAGKFTPEGGTVTIGAQPLTESEIAQLSGPLAQRKSSWVKLYVRDTGIGIPKEKIPKLFEGFVQGELPSVDLDLPHPEGSGLGLAICKQIVDEHGGQITIKSEENKGTTVEVLLPTDLRQRKGNLYYYRADQRFKEFANSPQFPKDKLKKIEDFELLREKIINGDCDVILISK